MSESGRNAIQRCCAGLSRKGNIYEKQAKKLSVDYFKDNLSRFIVILLYIVTNLGLALYVIIYRTVVSKANVFIVCARTSGMLLNFNGSLVVVLMLKQTILLIRTTALHKFLPIDDHISFHKFVGRFIAGLSVFHAIAHMINFGKLKGQSTLTRKINVWKCNWCLFMGRSFMGYLHGKIMCAIPLLIWSNTAIVHYTARNWMDKRISTAEWCHFGCHSPNHNCLLHALGPAWRVFSSKCNSLVVGLNHLTRWIISIDRFFTGHITSIYHFLSF